MQLLDSKIHGKLNSLRTMLKLRLFSEGVAWFLAVVSAAVVITLLLDLTLRLNDRPIRAGMLILSCIGILAVLWKRLISPLKVPVPAEDLAILVERRYAPLEDRLISSLQMEDAPPAATDNVSMDMIKVTADEANAMSGTLNFSSVIETKKMWRVWSGAGAAIVLIGVLSVAFPETMNLWFRRNVMLENVDWPQDTYLSVFYEDGSEELHPLFEVDAEGNILSHRDTLAIVRGGPLRLVVETADGSDVPGEVRLHASYPSVGDTVEELKPLAEDKADELRAMMSPDRRKAASGRTCYSREFSAVSEEFEFYFTGGDDKRDRRHPHTVVLVEPPSLNEVRFEVEAPPYMRQPGRRELDGSRGVISIPRGGKLYIWGKSTKPMLPGSQAPCSSGICTEPMGPG